MTNVEQAHFSTGDYKSLAEFCNPAIFNNNLVRAGWRGILLDQTNGLVSVPTRPAQPKWAS
jgi:hypothetical protein